MRIGLCGIDGSHAEDFIRHFNTEGRFAGHRVSAVWGGTPERTADVLAKGTGIAAVPTLEALIDCVDAVIVGDRDGGLHRKHALPCIEAGRPVFVDKPLSNSIADARAIIGAAERHGIPLLSGSALRWQQSTQALKADVANAAGLVAITCWGTWFPENPYGGTIYYAIHALELAQELAGPDWGEVRIVEDGDRLVVRYQSELGPATIELLPPDADGHTGFGVRLSSGGVTTEHAIALGDDYMLPVAKRIVTMLETGRGPLPPEALLAPVSLMAEIERLRG